MISSARLAHCASDCVNLTETFGSLKPHDFPTLFCPTIMRRLILKPAITPHLRSHHEESCNQLLSLGTNGLSDVAETVAAKQVD